MSYRTAQKVTEIETVCETPCEFLWILLNFLQMNEKKVNVFHVSCPACRSILWIDPVSQEVVKSEKSQKKKGTLDELLEKEKKRKSKFDRKFEATVELEREKKKKAQEKFAEVLIKIDPNE